MVSFWNFFLKERPDVERVRLSASFTDLKVLMKAGLIEGDNLGLLGTWYDKSGDIDGTCEQAIRFMDDVQFFNEVIDRS